MNINTTIDFNEKKGFVCDMDGVIYHGNQILNGVREFIQWLHDEKKEYLFFVLVFCSSVQLLKALR